MALKLPESGLNSIWELPLVVICALEVLSRHVCPNDDCKPESQIVIFCLLSVFLIHGLFLPSLLSFLPLRSRAVGRRLQVPSQVLSMKVCSILPRTECAGTTEPVVCSKLIYFHAPTASVRGKEPRVPTELWPKQSQK